MRGERSPLLSVIATLLAMALNLSGGTVLGASDTASLLAARSMTEEQYLQRMVPVFKELYGPMAEPAARLIWRNAGPVFAMDAMTRCYGEIWALQGPLGVKERSLATVSALVAQKLYPEIKLHINGFMSSGGTLEELCGFIDLAAREAGAERMDELLAAIVAGLEWREKSLAGFKAPSKDEVKRLLYKTDAVSPQQALLARLSAAIALGDMDKVSRLMAALAKDLPASVNRDAYMDQLVIHLVLYCGYPRGLNALGEWQKMREPK
jgi:alkylhydroperoxidase/carboxymuconolactone decarboxylase family protein YurZ